MMKAAIAVAPYSAAMVVSIVKCERLSDINNGNQYINTNLFLINYIFV